MASKGWNQVRYGWEDLFQDEILGIPSQAIQLKAANLRDELNDRKRKGTKVSKFKPLPGVGYKGKEGTTENPTPIGGIIPQGPIPTDTQENNLTNALTKDNGVAGREWNASFSPREKRALNQVRGSVAQNRARLKRDFGTPTQEIPQTPAQENKNPDFDTKTPTDPDNKNQWTPPPDMWNPDNPANKNVPDFGEAVEANKEGGLAQSGGQAGPTPKAMMAMAAKIFGQKGQKAPEQQVAHNPLDWDLDWQSSYSQGYW